MANAGKLEEAEKLMKKANKYWSPSVLDFRLKPDWESAAPLYEKAALAFKQAGQLEKSRTAYEKAAASQEKIGSIWHAAKHLETCANISKDLNQLDKFADFVRQSAQFFAEAGKVSAGADALARGARSLEERSPSDAALLYREAVDLYETDGKEAQAGDIFRQAISLLVRQQKWADAVGMLLRHGEACDKAKAVHSQNKAYLGAVVVWLYAEDARHAWQTYQDVLGVEAFSSSEEAFAADALFAAYSSSTADKVKAVVSAKGAFKQLDNQVARLALKLPQGDVGEQGRIIASLMGGGSGQTEEEEEEQEDELM